MSGRGPRLISLPTRIGTLPVGSTIKLNVNGTPWEFLVAHQGLPSDLYDASCDGTWLLLKDCYEERAWNSTNSNVYETSTINTWLNSDFLGLLDGDIQSAIKQVKIPYSTGGKTGTVQSGANGLPCKVFLLGGYEVGLTTSESSYLLVDGAKLDYFESGNDTSAKNKRIAYLNGSATYWWLRSPRGESTGSTFTIYSNGRYSTLSSSYSYGIRPAFILPSNFIVTDDMLAA